MEGGGGVVEWGGGGGWLIFNPLPVTSLGGAMATNRTTPLGSDLIILSA